MIADAGRVDGIATGWWNGQELDFVGAVDGQGGLKPEHTLGWAAVLDGEIRDGQHHMQVRVFYEDTDFSSAVYHASYLRFFERGRTNFLRLLGTDQRTLFAESQIGGAFAVRSMMLDFLKPARMDDVLDIVTSPGEVKGASITLDQECRRGGELLVKARVRVAFIVGGKAGRIPRALRDAMQRGNP